MGDYQKEREKLAALIAAITLEVAVTGPYPYHTICMALMDNMVATITSLSNPVQKKSIVEAVCHDLRKKCGV